MTHRQQEAQGGAAAPELEAQEQRGWAKGPSIPPRELPHTAGSHTPSTSYPDELNPQISSCTDCWGPAGHYSYYCFKWDRQDSNACYSPSQCACVLLWVQVIRLQSKFRTVLMKTDWRQWSCPFKTCLFSKIRLFMMKLYSERNIFATNYLWILQVWGCNDSMRASGCVY